MSPDDLEPNTKLSAVPLQVDDLSDPIECDSPFSVTVHSVTAVPATGNCSEESVPVVVPVPLIGRGESKRICKRQILNDLEFLPSTPVRVSKGMACPDGPRGSSKQLKKKGLLAYSRHSIGAAKSSIFQGTSKRLSARFLLDNLELECLPTPVPGSSEPSSPCASSFSFTDRSVSAFKKSKSFRGVLNLSSVA